MLIDAVNSMPVTQAPDVKVEKDLETEEPRAVEDSDKSGDSNFDVSSQNVARQSADMEVSEESSVETESYDAKGNLVSEMYARNDTGQAQDSINLVV